MTRWVLASVLTVSLTALADQPSHGPGVPDEPELAGAPTPPAAPAAAERLPFSLDGKQTISVTVVHGWSLADARARLGYLLSYWKQRFSIQGEWRGDTVYLTGRVWGAEVRARFEVRGSDIVGVALDPGTLMRGRIHGYVESKLKKYMHPNYDEP